MKEMDKDGFYTKINVNPMKTQFNLEKMCIDTWNWQKNNPNGYLAN